MGGSTKYCLNDDNRSVSTELIKARRTAGGGDGGTG
jgi:hypothetical protein